MKFAFCGLCLCVMFSACDAAPAPGPTLTAISLAVNGAREDGAIVAGKTAQFLAVARFSDGIEQDITSLASWRTTNATVATVSAVGLVHGGASGTASVTATYQGMTGNRNIYVAPAPLLSPPPGVPNWFADATVLATTNPGRACGWGISPGETRSGVAWRIIITGDSILLEEDVRQWPFDDIPFSGTLSGRQFIATFRSRPDYLQYDCPFREGTITGTISEEFTSFEALETLVWGPPGAETTVQRHWTGSNP